MSRITIPSALALGLALSVAPAARAHITLTRPPPRTSQQKEAPCGAAGSVRGDTVTVFRPGETILVTWDETIDHASHYRIAFDADGDDDFVSPAGRDDIYNSPAVLADGIEDRVGGSYSREVTLPDIECERCTLQLIQVMYGSGNYFQCADIALRRAEGEGPDAGTPGGAADAGTIAFGPDSGAPGRDEDAGSDPAIDAGSMPPPDASASSPAAPAAASSRSLTGTGCTVAAGPRPPWGLALLVLSALVLARRRAS